MPAIQHIGSVRIVAAAASIWIAACVAASAQTIGWHPSSPLYLGATFDPENPKDAKVPCLKDVKSNLAPVDTGAPSTEFRSSLVQEKQELFQLFSVSASFSARYGLSGAEGSASYLSQVNFDSETVVWTLSAKSNFGRTALTKVELASEYASLPPSVQQAVCGTHFIVMDRREAVVSAVFSFRSTSRKTREDIKAALSAGWTGGSFSASLSNELKSALARTEVSFVFLAKGGEGLTGTSGFVTTFDKLDELRKQVGEYIGKVTRENAPAAEYFTARLPSALGGNPLLDKRERTLGNLWHDYLKLDQDLREAKAKLQNLEAYWYLDAAELKPYLQSVVKLKAARIEELTKLADACIALVDQCTYTPDLTFESVDWPQIEPIHRGGGYGCAQGRCDGPAIFLVRIRGPNRPKSILHERVNLGFPNEGGAMGYNCRHKLPTVSEEGITFDCTVGYELKNFDKQKIGLVISDGVTGREAFRGRFIDVAPEHPFGKP